MYPNKGFFISIKSLGDPNKNVHNHIHRIAHYRITQNTQKFRICISQASFSSCSCHSFLRWNPSQYTHDRLQVLILAAPTIISYTQQILPSFRPGSPPCKHQEPRLSDFGVSVFQYYNCTILTIIAVSGSPGGGCDKGTDKTSIPELEPVTLGVYDGQSSHSVLRQWLISYSRHRPRRP